MNNKKAIVTITFLSIVVIAVIAIAIGNNIYKNDLQENVDIYISSVSLVENPDDPKNEEVYGLLNQFFNQTVGDICVQYDPLKEFSEAEKAMKFDLNTFNVFKIEIACEQRNSAENKKVFGKLIDYCKISKFMKVPCNVSSDIFTENTLYYFVSKEYSEEDVKQYLKNTGSPIYVCIGKDELRPIVNYNTTIFYEPDNKSAIQ